MKTNWKSIVAGLVLAFASTPLLAASTASTEQVKFEAQKAVVVGKVKIDDTLLFTCTAETDIIRNGMRIHLTATAATCAEAIRQLEEQF